MIKINGLTALELCRAGYKIVKHGREFFTSEKNLIKYMQGKV